jgi:hypothetical protein
MLADGPVHAVTVDRRITGSVPITGESCIGGLPE